MNGTRISALLVNTTVVVVICFYALSTQGKYGGGSGTPGDPYHIRDVNHMQAIGADSNDLDKHFLLCADIDLSGYTGTQFNIIGTNFFHPFTGVFNGNGHTISNFTYKSKERNIGLFVFVSGENAEIKNLGLLDPDIDSGARDFAGSLVGYLTRGTIDNCYVEGGIVLGSGTVGGLVSTNERGTITKCYSTGSFAGNYRRVGGLVGTNEDGTISNCYATGSVSGKMEIGGLLGWNYSSGRVMHSFWDIEKSGQSTSAGGTGLPTDQMQTMSTFTDAEWDFVGETFNGIEDIWFISEGDYPHLWWEDMQVSMNQKMDENRKWGQSPIFLTHKHNSCQHKKFRQYSRIYSYTCLLIIEIFPKKVRFSLNIPGKFGII